MRSEPRRPGDRPTGTPWVLIVLAGGLTCAVATLGVALTVTIATVALQLLFLAFFLRHLAFVLVATRAGTFDQAYNGSTVGLGHTPPLSVLVGCHNEERVLDRLLGALHALQYPVGLLQLVLVDDASSDRTGEILDRFAAFDPRATVLHRPRGSVGGKSGALNAALLEVTGEVVVVFDADHCPRPDVLLRLARHFADPGTGAVQGRCQILNGQDSLISELVEIDYLAGFLVNEYGRQAVFQLPAYGGACCAVRTSSLVAVGGWNEDSVTEDTDLTLRLLLSGQRVRYDVTAVDEEEAVVTIRRYWTQRYRWARGHQKAWREFRGAVWTSRRLTVPEKLETTMFLLGFHLPALAIVGVGLLVTGTLGIGGILDQATAVLWTLLMLGPMLELSTGMLLAGSPRRKAWRLVFFLPLFLLSMALCAKAWVDGILGRPYSWVKTARSGDADPVRADPGAAVPITGPSAGTSIAGAGR